MSLLEDVFLEDETEEARALERVIDGDEYETEQVRSDGERSAGTGDEAEEEKRRIDPTTKQKRIIKNPRFVLNPARLTGPRGIQVIPDHFKDFKFRGKGHERDDLDIVLKRLEHWAYRLYPKFKFEDCLKKIESLGKKRVVKVHLLKIRSDQIASDEIVNQKDSSDEEPSMDTGPPDEDEFDKLLQQQITIARSTPAPNKRNTDDRSPMPQTTQSASMTDDQRERMMRNHQLAKERRLARMKLNDSTINNQSVPQNESNIDLTAESNTETKQNDTENGIEENDVVMKRQNKSNVIDSSDGEDLNNEIISVRAEINDTGIDVESENNDTENDVVMKKQNKSHTIDSSDDEDSNNERISVHAEINDAGIGEEAKSTENKIEENDVVMKKQNKSHIIDSSDDEEFNNESILVHTEINDAGIDEEAKSNDTQNDVTMKRKNKSYAIDSSDDEDFNNESILVHAEINDAGIEELRDSDNAEMNDKINNIHKSVNAEVNVRNNDIEVDGVSKNSDFDALIAGCNENTIINNMTDQMEF